VKFHVMTVDCSQPPADGSPPILMLRREQVHPGQGAWSVANSPIDSIGIKWSIVTAASDFVRVPLFSYTAKDKAELLVAAGVQMGLETWEAAGQVGLPTEALLAIYDSQPAGEDRQWRRFWLGLALLRPKF